jgi:hypothetical protein
MAWSKKRRRVWLPVLVSGSKNKMNEDWFQEVKCL